MIRIMSPSLPDLLRALPARRRHLAAGSFLFHPDDPVRAMHLVLAGEVRLIRLQADGGSLVLQRAGAGAVLAEASLFAARYHCAAQAAAASDLLVFRRADLRTRLARDPGFAEAWTRHLAAEVQAARQRAEILSLNTVAARLDAWIAGNGGALPPKGAWRSIAQEIATSPEALYRELALRRRPKLGGESSPGQGRPGLVTRR